MSAISSLSSGILIFWSELWADRYSFPTWDPQSQMLSWRKLYQLLFVQYPLFYFKNKSKGGATCNSSVVRGTPRGEWRRTLLPSAGGGIKLAAPGAAPATKARGVSFLLLPWAACSWQKRHHSFWGQPCTARTDCSLEVVTGHDLYWQFVLPSPQGEFMLGHHCLTPARTPVNIFSVVTVKPDSPSSIVEKNAEKVSLSPDSWYNYFYLLYINYCKDWSNYISSYSLNSFTMHYVTSKVRVTFFPTQEQ